MNLFASAHNLWLLGAKGISHSEGWSHGGYAVGSTRACRVALREVFLSGVFDWGIDHTLAVTRDTLDEDRAMKSYCRYRTLARGWQESGDRDGGAGLWLGATTLAQDGYLRGWRVRRLGLGRLSETWSSTPASHRRRARLVPYGISDEMAFNVGLACGGRSRSFFQPFSKAFPTESGRLRVLIDGGGQGNGLLAWGSANIGWQPRRRRLRRTRGRTLSGAGEGAPRRSTTTMRQAARCACSSADLATDDRDLRRRPYRRGVVQTGQAWAAFV